MNKPAFDKFDVSVAYINKLLDGENIEANDGTVVMADDVTFPPKPTKSYAFCSDTAYFPSIIPHIEKVDLLYHEATFTEELKEWAKNTLHSTAREAAEIAKMANARKLILGHFSARYKTVNPFLEEARAVFPNTVAAKDGSSYEVEN